MIRYLAMTLTLPDEPALSAFREEDLRLELACALYSSRSISLGLAASLAGMDREAFEDELHGRGLTNGAGPAELEEDRAVLDRLLSA